MKTLLDTSVLVAAMVEAHPAHATALPWLQRAKDGVYIGLVAAHSLAPQALDADLEKNETRKALQNAP